MADRVNRRSSNGSYRSVGRGDSSSDDNVNVFSDDFAVDGSPVADGFRPTQLPSATRESAPRPTTPPRTNKPASIGDSKTDIARRIGGQSSSQAPAARNSFTLQHDTSDTPQRIPSMIQSDISRRISTVSSTSTAIPRTQSPYVGADAPSHPYGMYPQDTQLNRASTISSIRPSRPAHPYGMYPQDTTGESEANPLANTTDIASVGFPGLGHRYARRLGPDGEDADDIIGPDGHTEQLPPYTRFPDGVPPKERLASAIQEAFGPGSPQTPETSSPTEAGVPAAAAAVGAGAGVFAGAAVNGAGAPQSITDGTQNSEEHLRPKEKWVEKSKQRTCFGRLPVWAVALIIGAIVIVAAVVGALIGRLVPNSPKHPHGHPLGPVTTPAGEPESTSPFLPLTTTMADAAPLTATPTNLPTIPTGNFGVPIDAPTDSSSSCLEANPDEQLAWGCLMGGYMSFNVTLSDDDNPQVTLDNAWPIEARGLQYGPQAPKLTQPAGLALMQDINQPYLGPAYYFCQEYDKLVILPENSINESASQSKRSIEAEMKEREALEPRDYDRGALQPGEKPWFCWWNNTYLEGFIYLEKDTTATLNNVSNIISSMNTLETPAPVPAATSMIPAASTTSRDYQKWRRDEDNDDDDDDDDDDDQHKYRQGAALHNPQHEEKDANGGDDHFSLPASFPPVYPKAIKLEERRMADKDYKPYCDQMQVLYTGEVNYVTNPNTNQRVSVQIDEMSPPQKRAIYADARSYYARSWRRDTNNDDNGCRCVWMSS